MTDVMAQRGLDAPVATFAETLRRSDELLQTGVSYGSKVWATGFRPLDSHLTGGLRAGELMLLAGAQGLGKTTLALQVARNLAVAGHEVLYVCYEHPAEMLAERLLVLEAGLAAGPRAITLEETRRALSAPGSGGHRDRLAGLPGVAEAWEAAAGYADRLHLMSARGDSTTLEHVAAAAARLGSRPLVVVDYLQKVSLADQPYDDEVRVARVATGLKDLALDLEAPVIAIAALERAGLEQRRARARHLKGSVTLAYEADVILVLNEKYDIIARHHLMYDTANAERYHDWVVFSIEKNRSGETHIDMQFRKHFAQGRYDAEGGIVNEQLLDDRVHVE